MHNGIALLYTWNEHNIVNQLTVFLNIYNIIVNTENLLCLVTQSYPTLCDPMDCSPAGSSVHGILQARILEWVAISFSRASSQTRDRTRLSHAAGRLFTHWATREAPGDCWIPPKKRYPISKGKGEALVRKSHLESNPICVRDAQRAQKKPCVCQEQGVRR